MTRRPAGPWLPFLDLIFGAIGVFVVTFALQATLTADGGRPPSADAVIVCSGTTLTVWQTNAAEPRTANLRASAELLAGLAADLAGSGRTLQALVVAVAPDCRELRARFIDRGFDAFVASRRGAAAGAAPRLELWPVADAAAGAVLAKQLLAEAS